MIHSVAILKGAVEGDPHKHLASLLAFDQHAAPLIRAGLVDHLVNPTQAGLLFYDQYRLALAPDGRANAWDLSGAVGEAVRVLECGSVAATCPALSPETQSRCVLPDTRSAHRAGHESAWTSEIGGSRAVWGTTVGDVLRWDLRAEPADRLVWDQRETPAMRAERVTRSVVILGEAPEFRGDRMLLIAPAPGQRGRRTHITVKSFLTKFAPRKA